MNDPTRFRWHLRVLGFSSLVALAGLGCGDSTEQQQQDDGDIVPLLQELKEGKHPQITFMSRKLYAGADEQIEDAFESETPEAFAAAVSVVRDTIVAKNFPARAALMAEEVRRVKPDFLGIQEATTIRGQTPGDGPTTPATEVDSDFLKTFLAALADRGLHYEVVTSFGGMDVEFATSTNRDFRFTEGVALLARSDLDRKGVKLSNAANGAFKTQCIVPSIAGSFPLTRGWASIDVEVEHTAPFKVFLTHLDFTCLEIDPTIRGPQNKELIEVTKSEQPVVLIADLNSESVAPLEDNPEPLDVNPTYPELIAAGFKNAHQGNDGFNCCFEDDLVGDAEKPNTSIDFIFHRGGHIETVRDGVSGLKHKTAEGLHPSNHAGTFATLRFP
jgi:endonuclease/exonuclease/phosphatase family metal-dependent hydrolase